MKKVNRLGIDLDNTLSEISFLLKSLSEYYNKPLMAVENVKDYNATSVYGINHDDSRDFWMHVEHEICEKSELSTLRFESIYSNFVQNDTKIYIITNRNEKFREITENWLEINAIPYDELIMTSGKSKVDVMRQLEIDVMIDDKPSLFYEVAQAGLETTMVCVDYEFNKDVPCDARMTREGEMLYVQKGESESF